MAESPHSIRAEKLDIEVASEALAIALRPRLSDLNRQRFLPVIERVLSELDVPGRHVRIERIAVDLGELPLAGLEETAEAALYDALHRSLRAAIDGEGSEGTEPATARAEGADLIALLGYYLQRGTLPFWAPSMGMSSGEFSAASLVRTLAEREPTELVALFRRIRHDRYVLERLVLQLDERTLQILLRLLDPTHAALILAYMLDLRHIHRAEPVLSLGEAAFERLLWVLSLSYLVRDAGSQFNRKSFVVSILRGAAQSQRLDYRTLVETLALGLQITMRRLPLDSSLPAVIGEIVRDFDGEGGTDFANGAPPQADGPTAESVPSDAERAESDPSTLAALVRSYARDRTKLERLVSRLDESTLQAVLRLLEPVHAALIVAYLHDMRHIHRAEPIVTVDETRFGRLLWVLTLSYVVRDAGSQFNRRSFVRSLLEELAQSEGLDFHALVAVSARALRATAARAPLASSLPAVIEEIARDSGSWGAPVDVEPASLDEDAADPSALAAVIRTHRRDRWMLEALVTRLDDAALQAVLRLLESAHAELVIAYLDDLRRVLPQVPLLAQGDAAFRRLLWQMALSYVARDVGSQFDRVRLVRALLDGIAASEGLEPDRLLTALLGGLRGTADQPSSVASLSAVLDDLARELPARAAAVADHPEAIVDRYIRLDALIHYLRYGVLPVDVLLHRRDLSADILLTDLPKLDIWQLRALSMPSSGEGRLTVLLRLVRGLAADNLAALVHRLLPRAAGPDGPLQAALATAANASQHLDIFFARFIAAVLDGEELDLEAMVAASAEPAPLLELADDLTVCSAQSLVAALLARFRCNAGVGTDWISLLDALLARYPAEARSFLQALVRASEGDAFLERLPSDLFGRVLALARPVEAQELEFLLVAIGELPMAERPDPGTVRSAFILQALSIGSGTSQDLLQHILHAIFGGIPPEPVADRLAAAFGRAVMSEASRTALTNAIATVSKENIAAGSETSPVAQRDALFDWLRGTDSSLALSLDALLAALPEIIAAFPGDIRTFLGQHANSADLRGRWADTLPEAALVRLIQALEPRHLRSFVDSTELLHAAAAEVAAMRNAPPPARAAMWDALIGYLAVTPAAERSIDGLVSGFLARAAEDAEVFRATGERLAHSAGRQSLAAALGRDRPAQTPRKPMPVQPPLESSNVQQSRGRTAFSFDEADEPSGDPIYIDNAGLVLAGVFLPHLFRSLDLLVPNEIRRTQMRDSDAASRAVHLLQYLVDGRCSAPEPVLALNKVMCGLTSGTPILREIDPTERERDLCEGLLRAMISRWDIIKSSSVAALRETFLKRDGRLARKGEGWELRVDRKTVDVLVSSVPWNIALIYNDWMPQPLHVTW